MPRSHSPFMPWYQPKCRCGTEIGENRTGTLEDGWLKASLLSKMLWRVRLVFTKDYHPGSFSLATTKQNPALISWRRFHRAGGDVLKNDEAKMLKIRKI